MAITVFEINEFIDTTAATGASTLTESITLLQTGKTFTCPKCSGTGGFVSIDGLPKIICDVCDGYGKTVLEYEAYEAQIGYRLVES